MTSVTSDAPGQVQRVLAPHDALRHADALFHLARHLTGSSADAEDLVQETYARAFQAWSRLAPQSNVKAWLFRILRNLFLSQRRRDARQPADDPDADVGEVVDVTAGDAWIRGDIEVDRLRGRVASDIVGALGALSPDARALVLLDLEGFTESELAEVIDCPVGTVKSRLSRARARLRALLTAYRREVTR